jgi:hypothetical protein
MTAVPTKGTSLFYIDPDTCAVVEVGCITSFDGLDVPIDQVEITCLQDLVRSYMSGLGTPGTATFGINYDPQDASHNRLLEIKREGSPTLWWAIGWGDGTAFPVAGSPCDFDTFPTTRTFLAFEGFINSFSFSFALNAAVASTVGIQVSGDPTIYPKA